ncbi:MAG: hypothetical protein GY861_00685 [bacterium]|nr:hypothetical protein [bacterium]
MPQTINGKAYGMEEIDQLCRRKLELAKEAEILMNQLRKEVLTDEVFVRKEQIGEKEIEERREKMGPDAIEILKTIGDETKWLLRDEKELENELVLVTKLHGVLVELMHLSTVELQYFRAYKPKN